MTIAPANNANLGTRQESLSPSDFSVVADFINRSAAIKIETGKEYLVQTRLTPLARELGLASITDLVRLLKAPGQDSLRARVLDVMTTNETQWFRDAGTWEALRQEIMPEVVERRAAARRLTVWCGAASSGQEPFSLSIMLADHFPETLTWQRDFLGTDISGRMLKRCRDAIYSPLEINRGLSATALIRHFERIGPSYRVRDGLRAPWEFRSLNLARPLPAMARPDIVLLRNVLIYFDQATRDEVLTRISYVLDPRGWLILGGAEVSPAAHIGFERITVGKAAAFRLRSRNG